MGLGKLVRRVAFVGLMGASAMIGHYATLDREYHVERSGFGAALYCRSIEKSHPLTQYNGDVYLGSSAHHLQGVDTMKAYEAESPLPGLLASQAAAGRPQRSLVERITHGIDEGWKNLTENLR